MKALLIEASSFRVFQIMACVFKARINPQFNRACNLKGAAGFTKQTELCPYKNRSKSPTSTTISSNRRSNSIVKVLTIFLGLWCSCQQQEEHQLTAIVGYFEDQVLAKTRLLPIIAYRGTLFFFFFYACGDYMRSQQKTIGLIVNFLIS